MVRILKIVSAILFVLNLFLFVFGAKALAEDEKTPFEIAYQTYLNQISVYQSVHQDYVLRKSQYESFKTLQAQQDAQAATVKMLQERDKVVLAYMAALRERIKENPGVSETDKNVLYAAIDTQITWFSDHEQNIPTAGNLNDLAKDSQLAANQFKVAQITFYQSLSYLSDGKFKDLKSRFSDRFTELKNKIDEIKKETRSEYSFSTEKLLRLDRWVFDAQSLFERAESQQTDAETTILLFGSRNRNVQNLPSAYGSIISDLNDGQIYLKEAGGYLQEIVRDIKTDDN